MTALEQLLECIELDEGGIRLRFGAGFSKGIGSLAKGIGGAAKGLAKGASKVKAKIKLRPPTGHIGNRNAFRRKSKKEKK